MSEHVTKKANRVIGEDTTIAFPVGQQGANDKFATAAELRGTEDFTIATRNVRNIRTAGELEELLTIQLEQFWIL